MSLQSYFHIPERGSTVGREIIGGVSTFMAMSYIIFVQPAVLSRCPTGGMDMPAVMFATCLCSAAACLVMGLWANLPIALAPAMGHNIFFVFTVCGLVGQGGFGLTWQEALAANFMAGILFLLLSFMGLRAAIMNAIPDTLKFAIAAGIGMFIAFIGFQWSGIIVDTPVTYITMGDLKNPITLLSLFGLAVIGILLTLRFRAAILVGMLLTALAGFLATKWWGGNWSFELVGKPEMTEFPDVTATAGKFIGGFGTLFGHKISQVILVVLTFLMLDVFDTIGTLVGLGERAGLMQDGKLPNARQAMMADAIGTISGTIAGTSTITSYVESSAGIAAGARTGLAAVAAAVLFLISIVAYPLVKVFGSAVAVPPELLGAVTPAAEGTEIAPVLCYPIVAPVLIIVGCYMLSMVRRIDWDDFSEALPAFVTIIIMQISLSITDGIAWGFITFTILKLATGRAARSSIIVYIFAALFVFYYAYGRM